MIYLVVTYFYYIVKEKKMEEKLKGLFYASIFLVVLAGFFFMFPLKKPVLSELDNHKGTISHLRITTTKTYRVRLRLEGSEIKFSGNGNGGALNWNIPLEKGDSVELWAKNVHPIRRVLLGNAADVFHIVKDGQIVLDNEIIYQNKFVGLMFARWFMFAGGTVMMMLWPAYQILNRKK